VEGYQLTQFWDGGYI